ncbi:MFS transporter [Methylomarinum vadi]|uniref:MFS transporter n=1 Tax=Methylomarinum vadi TaxID=438855 RepID=UPI001F2064C5|nr:MFS transporter [Methylomarinum vadi]
MTSSFRQKSPHTAIPRTIWALGFVSLFMDLSSELIHSLLPVFLVTTLGASAITVGLIEGFAEGVAHIVKVFSGALSDFFARRKLALLLGYGLAAVSKPLFPLAESVGLVFAARFLDRIGKGIRGAPRDALVADIAPAEIRGACYGLRQSMDTIGAFLGPLSAMFLLWLLNDSINWVLWFACIPALIAVLLIVVAVDEPALHSRDQEMQLTFNPAMISRFSRAYWWVLITGALFTLARFSEAFLVLRAQQIGLSIVWIPSVMVMMNLCYALSAYPVGILSDRFNKRWLLATALLILILADLLLAHTVSISVLMLGACCWGLHMGFSQGVLTTLVAETTPLEFKGTAFGLFNFTCGILSLLASFIAGWLWDRLGAEFTFYGGAAFSLLALILLFCQPSKPSNQMLF